jgi:hypothetical protein
MKMFGQVEGLGLEIDPLEPTWSRAGEFDQGPWARLSIYLRGRCLTRAIDDDSAVRNGINVPLLPLAHWLVENIRAIAYEESNPYGRTDVNLHDSLAHWRTAEPRGQDADRWDDLRYEWYCRHFWLPGAEGSMVPDLAFVRSDDRLWISWSQPRFAGPRHLEFIEPPGCNFVGWDRAWQAMAEFVAFVAAEARRCNIQLGEWIGQEDPLQKAIQCTASDFVSLVAPETQSVLEELGIAPESKPEQSPSLQALRDVDTNPHDWLETARALRTLEEASPSRGYSRLTELRKQYFLAHELAPVTQGYDAARWLRQHLGLDGEPLLDDRLEQEVSTLAHLHALPANSLRNHSVLGLRSQGGASIVLLEHARTRHLWARRMELARALGHLFLDPLTSEGVMGAGSSAAARGPRRQRSGAFAAELLLPKSGIEAFLHGRDPSDGPVFEELMNHFRTGAHTAAHHLYNHGLLNYEDREQLIEDYGDKRSDLPCPV